MSVLIQINGENAGEAIRELSDLAAGITGKAAPAAAPAEAPKQTRTRKTEPVKETPAAEEDPKTTSAEPEDEPDAGAEPDEEGDPDEPVPTDVELRAVAAEVGKNGAEAKKAIKALLDKYGVPNITSVPLDKRIAFKRELEAI